MKCILFCVVFEKGYVNLCIGLVQYLCVVGCDVVFYVLVDISDQFDGVGGFVFVGLCEMFVCYDLLCGVSFVVNICDVDWLWYWICMLLIDFVFVQVDGICVVLCEW